MNVYKVTVLVIDFDDIGADEIRSVIENAHYANDCIAPTVKAMDAREIEWSDGHPLNRSDTADAEYERLFPLGPVVEYGPDGEAMRLTWTNE